MVSTQTPYNESTNPYVLYGDGWVPDYVEIVSRGYYTFLAVYMTVLFILSCFFNSVVIVATIKYKKLRKPINYLIVNLAVADLANASIGCTIPIFTNAVGYFYLGKYVCQFAGCTVSIFSIAFTWTWSIIWNTPPLVLWDGYVPEGVGTSCAPNWFSEGLR
ncbi:unnamed protein product [Clavelina lepadiformis]|uniref:G-protein coupled receptors family 1 profile domain-containing protein n=1 Tax=Clavelina lepadiformis TaxID=159417 RepID=A0ABP0FRM5_CLALP